MIKPTGHTIVFAGGGTAGHVQPALSVARVWMQKHPEDRCLFLGTPLGLENSLVPNAGFEVYNIEKVAMPRALGIDLLKLPLRLLESVLSARKIIKASNLLIGFGGYLSASAYLAAFLTKTPIVVHEANAKVGWANKLASVFTRNLAVARPISSGRYSRAAVTGIPLSAEIKKAYELASGDWKKARELAKEELGWNVNAPTMLILGGSQGSTFINQEIAKALPALSEKGIQILHSVGAGNQILSHSKNYLGVPYITDMATAYLAADVLLGRSGAVTCAEFATLGRMAIFVPLPIGNGEQARNADHLVESERAIVVSQANFSAQWLIDNIDHIEAKSLTYQGSASDVDLEAEMRIVALMETTISESGR